MTHFLYITCLIKRLNLNLTGFLKVNGIVFLICVVAVGPVKIQLKPAKAGWLVLAGLPAWLVGLSGWF